MHLINELSHQIKHAAQQQAEDYRPFVYGHISSYDPATHRVRLILPSLRDEDNNATLTGWMPLGTSAAGNGYGIQVAPLGGATPQNPTAGELCLIGFVERQQGVTVVASQIWNQVNQPPNTALAPGEAVIQANGGSFVYLRADKSIEVHAKAAGVKVIADAGDVAVTATSGKVTVSGSAEVDVTSTGAKVAVTAATEIDITAPLIKLNGAVQFGGTVTGLDGTAPIAGTLAVAGEITAKAGTGGSVSVSGHTHTQGTDSHGDTEAPTAAPTGGT